LQPWWFNLCCTNVSALQLFDELNNASKWFFHIAATASFPVALPLRRVTRGNKEGAVPLAPSHYGVAKSLRGASKSTNQCRKHFLQNSTFAFETPQFRTWGRQTCFLSRAPSNLVTPLLPL